MIGLVAMGTVSLYALTLPVRYLINDDLIFGKKRTIILLLVCTIPMGFLYKMTSPYEPDAFIIGVLYTPLVVGLVFTPICIILRNTVFKEYLRNREERKKLIVNRFKELTKSGKTNYKDAIDILIKENGATEKELGYITEDNIKWAKIHEKDEKIRQLKEKELKPKYAELHKEKEAKGLNPYITPEESKKLYEEFKANHPELYLDIDM